MWNEAYSQIRQELSPQEELLWSGQPGKGVALRASDFMMIPFSLLWGGFAIFWEVMVIRSSAPLFMQLWGIPFVLAGLYMIVGRFFVDAWQRERTVYGVTNERIIIISTFFNRKVKSLNLQTLPEITFDEKSDGRGTITFGAVDRLAWLNTTGFGRRRNQPVSPSFEVLAEAKKVYEIIRAAQRQPRKIARARLELPTQ
jgi:hypothetical protein